MLASFVMWSKKFDKKKDQGKKMKAFCPLQTPNGIGTIV
jgi:hypothetical protein